MNWLKKKKKPYQKAQFPVNALLRGNHSVLVHVVVASGQ